MQSMPSASRRDFIRAAAATAGVGALSSTGAAAPSPRDADVVLAKLLEGNTRFINGQTSLLSRRRPSDFAALAEGQEPSAIIVACADSRVAPELIFDQGVGDLFVVRVAGNVVSGSGPIVAGSIEFAVAELGARLIVVLGHTRCGAVKAAIQHIDKQDSLPGSINGLVELIKPAVTDVRGTPGDKLDNVIKANVRRCVGQLKTMGPILPEQFKSGGLKAVGGVYDLATGKVDIVG
ncbi:carbonic anhydrase [Paludisphaera mucosa]|uniref:Carbonic anhydrase n=1 Tax=Paludisphaera mucosa TaxID=3030827 RepID=A0ABT6F633_9BACT|nr:carbonic anhydrase [Paludisphaera mucosa]MDG3002845.1 carbonic anhydrase [Paludisphaera mucosa]